MFFVTFKNVELTGNYSFIEIVFYSKRMYKLL
jgi:hypothetical protein